MAIDQRVKYRHIQCFLEVARQQSVVKAAALYRSPSRQSPSNPGA
jgi:hypothetical protein